MNLARYLVSTVVFLALARFFLDGEEFGLAGLATVVVGFVGIMVRSGTGTALVQLEKVEPGHYDAAFWFNVGLGIFWTLVLVALSGPIAAAFGNEALAPVIIGVSPLLLLTAIGDVQGSILTRELRFRDLAVRTGVSSVVGGVVGLSLAFAGAGVWSLVGLQLASGVAGVAVLWWASPYRPAWRQTRRHLRDLFPIALPMIGIGLISSLGMQSDQLLLGLYGSVTAVGVYSVGKRIIGFVQNLTINAFVAIAVPTFSRLQSERDRLRLSFYRTIRVSSALGCLAFGFIAIHSRDMIDLSAGSKWLGVSGATSIMAVTGIFYSISFFFGPLLIAIGNAKVPFRMNLVATALMIMVGVILEVGTISGVALLILVRVGIMFVVWLFVMKRVLDVPASRVIEALSSSAGVASVALVVSGGVALVIPDLPHGLRVLPAGIACLVVYRMALPRLQPAILGEFLTILDQFPPGLRSLRRLLPASIQAKS